MMQFSIPTVHINCIKLNFMDAKVVQHAFRIKLRWPLDFKPRFPPARRVDSETLTSIRIFNGCEMRIENSLTRVTVRHHEWRNFQFAPIRFLVYFLSTTSFRLEYVLFYQLYGRITTFSSKKYSVRLLLKVDWTFELLWDPLLTISPNLLFWKQITVSSLQSK